MLQHLLHNKEGKRIAIIVNDVASINIDSKLISRSTTEAEGMIQLENGCACCSLSEELLTSVSELVTLSDLRGEGDQFDHIVVELSGVADPRAIRSKFQEALLYGMPLMERVRLDTMVTVIDASMYLDYLSSEKLASRDETPELFGFTGADEEELDEFDDIDLIPSSLLASLGRGSAEPSSPVADLLVSQTETCDVVVINKCDLVESTNKIREIVSALNPRAAVTEAEFGEVDPIENILAAANGKGIADFGIVDDHKEAVKAFEENIRGDASIAHDHDHDCADPKCTDESHDHSTAADSGHSHSHEHTASSSYSHDHEHSTVADSGHSHSHEHAASSSHSHDPERDCADPNCTDESHSHDHQHGGIGTFVYKARRPFHPERLIGLLHHLPVVRGLPDSTPAEEEESSVSIFRNILRSKGFAWCADSHVAAMYWSHAGSSFEMQCLGRWWATLPRDQWPPEAVDQILMDFGSDADEAVGDRRQEVVLIGQGMGSQKNQAKLKQCLDRCLVNDIEWEAYQSKQDNEQALKGAFPNPMDVRMVTY